MLTAIPASPFGMVKYFCHHKFHYLFDASFKFYLYRVLPTGMIVQSITCYVFLQPRTASWATLCTQAGRQSDCARHSGTAYLRHPPPPRLWNHLCSQNTWRATNVSRYLFLLLYNTSNKFDTWLHKLLIILLVPLYLL